MSNTLPTHAKHIAKTHPKHAPNMCSRTATAADVELLLCWLGSLVPSSRGVLVPASGAPSSIGLLGSAVALEAVESFT